MTKKTIEEECCPPFDPAPWDNKFMDWENKRFIKERVITLFYMPLNFGQVIRRIMRKADASGAVFQDNLCLSDHTSRWNMDIYLAVDKEIKGIENLTLTGKYYSRVYEGDFKKTGDWCADYEQKAKEKKLNLGKYYMWYTTCPKCAKKYGKNYVGIIGEIVEDEKVQDESDSKLTA
jgi:hypothetical protein